MSTVRNALSKIASPASLKKLWASLRLVPGGGRIMGGIIGRMAPYTGTIKVDGLEVPLHTRGRFTSVEEVRQQVVFSSPTTHGVARIGDVAQVGRRLADPVSMLRIDARDDPALMLSVEMQPGHNIVEFGHDLARTRYEVDRSSRRSSGRESAAFDAPESRSVSQSATVSM